MPVSDTPPAPRRCCHYDEDGTPWREGGCLAREACPDIHPAAADDDDVGLWASANAPRPALPGYMYRKLHPEKAARRGRRKADMTKNSQKGQVEEREEGEVGQSELGDWETDDDAEVEVQGASQRYTSASARPASLTTPGPVSATGDLHPAERVVEHKPAGAVLPGKKARKLHDKWKERIRLISACATSSETISALTADIAANKRLLPPAPGRYDNPNDDDTGPDAFASHGQGQEQGPLPSRLAQQHTAILARLEDEKVLNMEARAHAIGAIPCLPPGVAADDAARERLKKLRAEREAARERERVQEKEWERREREREWVERERKETKQLERERKERENGQSGPPQNSPRKQVQLVPSRGGGPDPLAPPKRKTRRKKSQVKKNRKQKATPSASNAPGQGSQLTQENVREQDDEEDSEAEEREVLEEGEIEQDPVEQQEKALAAAEDERKRTSEETREQDEQHELVRSRMDRLSNKVAMIKSVLGEMHEMTRHRAAQRHTAANDASQPVSNVNKRKREPELGAEADKGVQDEPRVRAGPADSHLATPPHRELASARELNEVSVELERYVHHVADIHAQKYTDENSNAITEILQAAVDEVRAQRASAAGERVRLFAQEQAAVHAKVKKGLAQATNKTASLGARLREGGATVAGLVSRVDSLERTMEQERTRRDEARTRVEEMKSKLKLYTTIQTRNDASISSLRATLDACAKQASDSGSNGSPVHIQAAPASCTTPSYPSSLAIAQSLVPCIADTARPMLTRTHSEVTGMLEQNSSRMLRTFDARMQQTLDIVEELTTRSMRRTEAHIQAPEVPFYNEDFEDDAMWMYASPQMNVPPGSCQDSSIPAARSHSSDRQTSYRRPSPHPFDYTLPLHNYQSCPYTLSNITNTTISGLNSACDPSSNAEIPFPKTDMPRTADQPSVSHQLDCSFLTDPDLRGVPVRLQHKNPQSGVWWPLAFVKAIPPAVSHGTSVSGHRSKTSVEVQDCRIDPTYCGRVYCFPLDMISYMPPTERHQVVVCVVPGVDRAQQYYVLGFNEYSECFVRKHPKVPNAKLIYFATHLLAQVAPPSAAPVPSAPSVLPVPSNATVVPKAHFNRPPPMWLNDLAFSGVPIHLQEHDGDGSIFELIAADSSMSTVLVRLLEDPASRKRIPFGKVQHVTPSASRQMVVAIAGYSQGLVMKVETYGEEECIVSSPLRFYMEPSNLEQRYKTAELAVISVSRKR